MAEPIGETMDNLVVRAKTDPAALGQLYERHYAPVLRYCIHRLFIRDVAEDATSEVFLKAARGIREFRGQTEKDFANWLYAIATSEANSTIRKRCNRQELLAAAISQRRIHLVESVEDCHDEPDWATLYESIASLPRLDQSVVVLRSFEQLPFEQIASICNMKTVAARVAFSRALAKLRKRLTKAIGRGR